MEKDDNNDTEVSVALCSYRRPNLLDWCLSGLILQETEFKWELVIVDNDKNGSARDVVERWGDRYSKKQIEVRYGIEPEKNIALARNRAISLSKGSFIAFLDDDERPEENWLVNLYRTAVETKADGVFGPVVPEFDAEFPIRLTNCYVFYRARSRTGKRRAGINCATNNAMLSRDVLNIRQGPFDRRLGLTGGSDTELFNWLDHRGCRFVWCDEAEIVERQGLERAKLRWHLRRGYRVGYLYAEILVRDQPLLGRMRLIGNIMIATTSASLRALVGIKNPYASFYGLAHKLARQGGKLGALLKRESVIEYAETD